MPQSLIEVTEVPGKGIGILQKLQKVPGTGTEVLQNSQKFRVLWHGRTELTEVPGGYKKKAVLVPRVFCGTGAYRVNRSSGYGCERRI